MEFDRKARDEGSDEGFESGELDPLDAGYNPGMSPQAPADGSGDIDDNVFAGEGPDDAGEQFDPHAEITTNDRGEFLDFRQRFDGTQAEVPPQERAEVADKFFGSVRETLDNYRVPVTPTFIGFDHTGQPLYEHQRQLRIRTRIDGKEVEAIWRIVAGDKPHSADFRIQELVDRKPAGEGTIYEQAGSQAVIRRDIGPPEDESRGFAAADWAVVMSGEVPAGYEPSVKDPEKAYETEQALGLNGQPISQTEYQDVRTLMSKVLAKKEAEMSALEQQHPQIRIICQRAEGLGIYIAGDNVVTNQKGELLGFRQTFDGTQPDVPGQEQEETANNLLGYVREVLANNATQSCSLRNPATGSYATGREHVAVSSIDGRKVVIQFRFADWERPHASVRITDFESGVRGDEVFYERSLDSTVRRSDIPRPAPVAGAGGIAAIMGIPGSEIVGRFLEMGRTAREARGTEQTLGFNNMPIGLRELHTLQATLDLALATRWW